MNSRRGTPSGEGRGRSRSTGQRGRPFSGGRTDRDRTGRDGRDDRTGRDNRGVRDNGYRDDRGGSRGGYGRPSGEGGRYTDRDRERPGNRDRSSAYRDDRAPGGRYRDDRAPGGSRGSGGRRPERGHRDQRDRGEGRGYGEGRTYGERRGYGEGRTYGEDRARGDDRSRRDGRPSREDRAYRGDRSFQGDRANREGRAGRDGRTFKEGRGERANRDGSREYGRREDRPREYGQREDRRREYGQGERAGFRAARGGARSRDGVQTIGGENGGLRARYGRDRSERGAESRPRSREDRSREDRSREDRSRENRSGEDRTREAGGGMRREGGAENPFKTSRQPLRDPDFYDDDYADERDTTEVPDGERLQKVLAQAGVASRRACEEMIGDGRVTVDGQVVRRFGARVDPAKQVIHVDGRRVPTSTDLVYYALNKPIGVVSTMDDPEGRPCLHDYVQDLAPRLFHVGRLDTETEGLLLFTNDGELAHRLTHPSYGVAKKYWAKVPGPVPRNLHRVLREGVALEDGTARADEFRIVQEHGQQALVEIVLHEGRKHIVRRMLEAVGHRVIDLARIEFGPVKLGRLKPGTLRSLTVQEVGELYAAVGM